MPFIGSRAVAGRFDPALLALKDADGVTLDDAIRAFGLDPGQDRRSSHRATTRSAFVEMHIEQGPVLEAEESERCRRRRPSWARRGSASRSRATPTTPAPRRCICAAMRWPPRRSGSRRWKRWRQSTEGLVATVGKIAVEPNAGNVIPGTRDAEPRRAPRATTRARMAAVDELLAAGRGHRSAARTRARMRTTDGSTRGADGRTADGVPGRGNRSRRFPAKTHAQRRRPRRHGDGRARAHGHALSAQSRRHQPPSRRSSARRGCGGRAATSAASFSSGWPPRFVRIGTIAIAYPFRQRGRTLHHLGATRSSLKHDHLLQTPDTFVRTPLPGADGRGFHRSRRAATGRALYADDRGVRGWRHAWAHSGAAFRLRARRRAWN